MPHLQKKKENNVNLYQVIIIRNLEKICKLTTLKIANIKCQFPVSKKKLLKFALQKEGLITDISQIFMKCY